MFFFEKHPTFPPKDDPFGIKRELFPTQTWCSSLWRACSRHLALVFLKGHFDCSWGSRVCVCGDHDWMDSERAARKAWLHVFFVIKRRRCYCSCIMTLVHIVQCQHSNVPYQCVCDEKEPRRLRKPQLFPIRHGHFSCPCFLIHSWHHVEIQAKREKRAQETNSRRKTKSCEQERDW
jgi:hypothetical protein